MKLFDHLIHAFVMIVFLSFSSSCFADPKITRDKLDVTIEGRSLAFDVLIAVPEGTGTEHFPVTLVTHGAAGRQSPLELDTSLMSGWVRNLAARGYLAVAVMRRGYGKSDGPAYRNDDASCASPDLRSYADAQADDLAAALRVIAERPDADMSTVIGIGHSAGAVVILDLAARSEVELRALVNVSGGIFLYEAGVDLAPGDAFANCASYKSAMEDALAEFATRIHAPTLWLYAENDPFFGPEIATDWVNLWRSHGATADLEILPSYRKSGHRMFIQPEGQTILLSSLDRFLKRSQLPSWSDTVELRRLRAALQPAQTERMDVFLNQELAMKAMAVPVTNSDVSAWAYDAHSLEAAKLEAKAICEEESGQECMVVLANFRPTGRLPN